MFRATSLRAGAAAFYMPPASFIGAGALKMAGPKLKSMNIKHAFIVTDKGVRKAGLLEPVMATLKQEANIHAFDVFDDVQPNPTVQNVLDGLEHLNKTPSDVIISVGGGSPQDAAKIIAVLKTNGGKMEDYYGLGLVPKPQFPIVAINTTAGTASEITRYAVVTDAKLLRKMLIGGDELTTSVAIVDAELMLKLPKGVTAATGMDALTHAVEAYVSNIASPVTDACALQAVRLVKKHLCTATHHGDNIVARDGMCYAEYLAGMAFNSASVGYVHAMAHQLGAVYHLAHGVCNAILLPIVEDYNKSKCAHRLRDVAEALGVSTIGLTDLEAADAAVDAMRQLSHDVEIPSGLSALGVPKDADLMPLAEAALKDVACPTNPRVGDKHEILKLYQQAL